MSGLHQAEIGYVIKEPGSTVENKTGQWRTFRPVIDYSKCKACGWCWAYCPEPAVEVHDGRYVINYDYCKGCGICQTECPLKCIEMVREEE